jgi:quercetin dioxygenase-like cupin family protein
MNRALLVVALLCAVPVAAEEKKPEAKITSPADIKWETAPGMPTGAMRTVLAGNPSAAGIYVVRVKLPAGARIAPHSHPNDELVTILSGTVLFGTGPKETGGAELAAGTHVVIPSGTAHWAMAKTDVVYQTTGVGPTGIKFVNPADDPRNKK